MNTLKYKGKLYAIEFGAHIGNHAKQLRKMLNDNHTLIHGKKVTWKYYDYDHYRPFSISVTYLGKASETESWIDEPGECIPQKIPTKELEVGYVGFF